MIKTISNLAGKNKIKVESRLARFSSSNNSYSVVSSSTYAPIKKEDIMFVKLTFEGLASDQKLGEVRTNLIYINATLPVKIGVVPLDSVDISDNNILTLANGLGNNINPIEQLVIGNEGTSLEHSGLNYAVLDVTKICENITTNNNSVMFAVVNNADESITNLSFESLQMKSVYSVVATATLIEESGISSLYKYDKHELFDVGSLNINLYNGKPIYLLDLFTTSSRKFPIHCALAYNKDKCDDIVHIKNNITPNFHYAFEKEEGLYTIEDYTGHKRNYRKLSRTNESKLIKTLVNDDGTNDLYYNNEDGSYFNIVNGTITLYDNKGNETTFTVSEIYNEQGELTQIIGKIIRIKDTHNNTINYIWDNNRLNRIVGVDGEEVLFTYNSAGYLVTILFPKIYKMIKFEYTSGVENDIDIDIDIQKVIVSFKNIIYGSLPNEGYREGEIINVVEFEYINNYLIKVSDTEKGFYLFIQYENDKVSEVYLADVATNEKMYYMRYSYSTNYTKLNNHLDEYVYYYFDVYGRVVTELNHQSETKSYNYADYMEGSSNKLISESKIISHTPNLLASNLTIPEDDSIVDSTWTIVTGSPENVENVTGGISGKKCLKIVGQSTQNTIIKKVVSVYESKRLTLSGFVKYDFNPTNLGVKLKVTYDIYGEGSLISTGCSLQKNVTFEEHIRRWYKFEDLVIELPDNAVNVNAEVSISLNGVDGTVYFDELVLSKSSLLNKENYIVNGYMENIENELPLGWEFENIDSSRDKIVYLTPTDEHNTLLGNKVMRFGKVPFIRTSTTDLYNVRKMKQTINMSGRAKDVLIYSIFAKAFVTVNTNFKSIIKFTYSDNTTEYFEFDFQKNCNDWQILTREVAASKDYNQVEVSVEYDGMTEVYLDCFQLYKDSYGRHYSYDDYGHLTNAISSNGNAEILVYKDNKVVSRYTPDGNQYIYEYMPTTDGKIDNRVLSIKDSNNIKITYEYDTDDLNRVKTTTIENMLNENEEDKIIRSSEYQKNTKTETITDEHGKISTNKYDALNNLIQSVYPNQLILEYFYDDKSQLTKLCTELERVVDSSTISDIFENNITYDKLGNITKISNYNDTNTYLFEYDKFGRITKIIHNGSVLENYEYGKTKNNINLGLLTKKQYGLTGDYYEFRYDNDNLLRNIELNGSRIATYGYDDAKRISYYSDDKTAEKVYLTYDEKGRLKKVNKNDSYYFEYEYDNLDHVQSVTYTLDGQTKTVYYDYPEELNEYTRNGYFSRLTTLFSDEVIVGSQKTGFFGATPTIDESTLYKDQDLSMELLRFNNKKNYLLFDLETFNTSRKYGYTTAKRYNHNEWSKKFYNNKTFYAWVKPIGSFGTKTYLLGFKKSSTITLNNSDILSSLYIKEDGRLSLNDNNITTSAQLNLNQWNLVGVKFTKNKGESSTKCKLILNDEVTCEYVVNESVFKITELLVGYQMATEDVQLPLSFDICLISGGAHSYTDKDFTAIYQEGLKYIPKSSVTKHSGVYYYDDDAYEGFEISPLKGTLTTSNRNVALASPKHDNSFKIEKDKFFEYDSYTKTHSAGFYNDVVNLTSDSENRLAYKMNLEEQGTITLNFKIKPSKLLDKRYIFTCMNEETNHIGLAVYFDTARWLYLQHGSYHIRTDCALGDDIWHHLFVTYNDEKITVYVDGEIANITEATIDLTNNNIYVGHNPLNTTMAFDGNIEMLAFKNELLSMADLRSKLVNNYCTHIGKEYDSLNRVVKNKIKTNESTFTIDYTYDKYRPIREEYSNGESINYSYDEMGNIITKTTTSSLGTEIISYEYDKIGRLTKEIRGNEQTTEYTYDIYGNLTSTKTTVGTNTPVIKTYSYSGNNVTVTNVNTNTVKTLLEYNSNNKGFPSKMFVGLSLENLTWEGNRLKSIGTDITYVYNLAGIRTKKTTPYETTTYVVDGSKIIRMNKKLIDDTVITIDFMYDQNDILIQAKTKEGCYFYVRDITGNINGLIDKNGNYVVKYRYDAWGNVLNTSITQNVLIAEHNPFLYKGYYYDVETSLFWLSSRYYSPELCRFIQPADVSSLNPYSINGLNMFSYGKNNPINNSYINNRLNYNSSFRIYTKLLNRLSAHLMFSDFDYAKNHRNLNRGTPNSIGRIFYPDGSPKQEREYGPDGRPVVDHDHHPGEDVGYDHDHDWDWDKNPPRQPAREPSKVLAALGIIGTGVALIWLVGNDATGYGVVDDGLIPAVAISFVAFLVILFNEGEDNTW